MTGTPATPEKSGAGRRLVVNVVGALGLVFGALPILKYVLELDFFDFAVAPYGWLQLSGLARLLPPAVVLVACLGLTYVLERRATPTS